MKVLSTKPVTTKFVITDDTNNDTYLWLGGEWYCMTGNEWK